VSENLLTKAKNLEGAGLKMIVISMASGSNNNITKQLSIPTISFRSSFFCDGKVELLYDLLGLSEKSLSNKKNNINEIISSKMVKKFIQTVHNRKNQ
jgi:3-methyl-2-oxobutanoate hydroxymethyltransferase